MKKRTAVWTIAALTLGLMAAVLLVACGEDDLSTTAPQAASGTGTAGSQTQPAPAAKLSGTIEIDGSSTVFPVSEAVAEEFGKLHPDVRVNVGVSGTGGGFKRFTVGETDISDASRPIKESEAIAAADNGVGYIELKVGTDGLSVMVNPQNDFAACLTTTELKSIWEPGSTIDNWSQVRAGFPDRPLRLYGPDSDSGTFDYFTEEINGEAQASRSDYTASADDNVLVTGIGGDRNSLGYFGYAYYSENADKLKLVAVDAGDGCVTPTAATIEDGTYQPLSRPMFIYVSKQSLERPEVAAFVQFYLENARELVQEVGYVPLPEQAYTDGLAMVRSGQTSAAPAAPPAAKLSGTIEIDGSSTVFPVSEAVAEEFGKLHPDVRVNVGVSGTGGGFKRFTVGETDISDASRPIKETEATAAADNGIEYIELKVGTDGLSVMVNPQNDFAACLTTTELKSIWEPGSTIDNWSQVRAGFPDRPLRLYGPDSDSGTFDYFTEEINGEAQASRSDYTASADDNVLVTGIGGDRNSLGYFGYAYYSENADKLKLVAVDAGDGCVTPTAATIEDGSYQPLSRPMFIYVSKQSLERPEVAAFVQFYLENARELVQEVGYVPLPAEAYKTSLAKVNGSH